MDPRPSDMTFHVIARTKKEQHEYAANTHKAARLVYQYFSTRNMTCYVALYCASDKAMTLLEEKHLDPYRYCKK